jgi:hypothetical protein
MVPLPASHASAAQIALCFESIVSQLPASHPPPACPHPWPMPHSPTLPQLDNRRNRRQLRRVRAFQPNHNTLAFFGTEVLARKQEQRIFPAHRALVRALAVAGRNAHSRPQRLPEACDALGNWQRPSNAVEDHYSPVPHILHVHNPRCCRLLLRVWLCHGALSSHGLWSLRVLPANRHPHVYCVVLSS